MLHPQEALTIQDSPGEGTGVSDAIGQAAMKDQVDKARLVQVILHAKGHFVYFQASRTSTSGPWTLLYQDSMADGYPECRDAAQNLARYLGLLSAGIALPASQGGLQRDGWSCGLWSLQEQEHQLRLLRHEPVSSKIPIQHILQRLNDFATRVSPAAKKLLEAAKAKKSTSGASGSPMTFEEAVAASFLCTKCHATKLGTKGCSQCMGSFFQAQRLRRGKAINGNGGMGLCHCTDLCTDFCGQCGCCTTYSNVL